MRTGTSSAKVATSTKPPYAWSQHTGAGSADPRRRKADEGVLHARGGVRCSHATRTRRGPLGARVFSFEGRWMVKEYVYDVVPLTSTSWRVDKYDRLAAIKAIQEQTVAALKPEVSYVVVEKGETGDQGETGNRYLECSCPAKLHKWSPNLDPSHKHNKL